jgi:hypothetical protein
MIKIGNFEITHDGSNYTLYSNKNVVNKETGETEVKKVVLGYYVKIEMVAERIANEKFIKVVRDFMSENVEEVIENIKFAKMMEII